MITIHTDVNDNTNGSFDRSNAADAFLERWKDPKEVSKDDEGAKPENDETVDDGEFEEVNEDQPDEEAEKDPSEAEDEEVDEDAEVKEKPVRKAANDEDEITFTVDGKEHKASVKELKRLAGQESALTRKSQEVATEKKVVEDTKNLHYQALNTLVKRAEDRYKPFANIDMLLASKQMSAEDFQAVREEANSAYKDLQYLTQELGGFTEKARQEHAAATTQSAEACIKYLTDEKTGIKGWDQKLYDEVRVYAKGAGMSAQVVDNITDPAAIIMMHKAMRLDKMQKVATAKRVGSAKKILKSTTNVSTTKTTNDTSVKTALAKLKSSGSRQSAADLLTARWSNAD